MAMKTGERWVVAIVVLALGGAAAIAAGNESPGVPHSAKIVKKSALSNEAGRATMTGLPCGTPSQWLPGSRKGS
jgi:hypothetical protein